VKKSESAGFATSSQRRGETPLVLLLKRSGHISAKSGMRRAFTRSLWSWATPFTLCEPTTARCAIRIAFSGDSSMIDMRPWRS
jgi:hypothetical protein